MSATNATSTGHEASGAGWLDVHFESSRPEYEDALRAVGIRPGWNILDAGCGGGSFLPLMADLTGPAGTIAGLDLAPENIARVEALADRLDLKPRLAARVGSVLDLPFADATFDLVWSANVMQYLTIDQFGRATREALRVLKPGGLLAVKDFDSTILQLLPLDRGVFSRFMAARLQAFRDRGVLGTDCGSMLPGLLRERGADILWRRGWLVERWAPLGAHTDAYVRDLLSYFATVAPNYDLPAADQRIWRDIAARPDGLLDRPDLCYREFFVVTVCRKPMA